VTVREAFEKAYGPIPEGATCHIGTMEHGSPERGWRISATYYGGGDSWPASVGFKVWSKNHAYKYPIGPDLSDRQAHWFLGFFGPEYDRVVAEDQAAWRAALHGARVSVSDAEDDGA
jgi:hypothetical protein